MKRWLIAALMLVLSRGRPKPRFEQERIVPDAPPSPRAELVVFFLLICAAVCAAGFPVAYAIGDVPRRTQFLGLSLGLALGFAAAALIVVAKYLIVTEELEEPYSPPEQPELQEELEEIVRESGDRITRKKLLALGGGAAATALGIAIVTPALSLGPALHVESLFITPWRRGRRLVDEKGHIFHADDIEENTFYTAFPEHSDKEELGAPLVVVRLPPSELRLPAGRDGWAPDGILAYSKICTHAGCAVNLYRKPTFPRVDPRPALICPCHYSTFDPAKGAEVIFGPAGRPLPQLPLQIASGGVLEAAGNFSGAVGPAWWGVRNRSTRSK